MALKEWNIYVFGNVQEDIKNVKHSIQELQTQTQDHNTILTEQNLQYELHELLKREECLWKDKAKARWIQEGDTHTRYFHLSTFIHRRYNSITTILSTNHEWLSSRHAIGETFQQFHENLFTSIEPYFPGDFQPLINPIIT